MNIPSQILVGSLDQMNRKCIDWGINDLIAYGCQSIVVLYDTKSAKILQTLDNRKGIITCVKWSNTICNNLQIKLASGDDCGNVSVWNVCNGALLHEFNESSNKQTLIKDLKWISYMDTSIDYLLVLYRNNNLSLWNCETFSKIWSKSFGENILQVSIDPHVASRIALLTGSCIMFIEDFNLNQSPQNPTRRFQITNMNKKCTTDELSVNATTTQQRQSSSNFWFGKLVETANLIDQKLQITAQTIAPQQPNQLDSYYQIHDCLQIEFSPVNKNILCVMFPKEIFLFDLVINQTVDCIFNEKSIFYQMYLCTSFDAIYCLHENGCLSLRNRFQNDTEQNSYILAINLDSMRLTKSSKIHGFCILPTNERFITILINDGRLITYELSNNKRYASLKDAIEQKSKLKINSLLQNLPQMPFVIKYCPPMTKKNWSTYEPLLSIGDSNGDLYVYQMHLSNLWRKFTIHTHAIRGIEWTSLKSVLTWSNNSSLRDENSGKMVKNEIFHTDLTSGQSKVIRDEANGGESMIVSIKTSYLKQYFVILFKEQPLELWDLKSFTMIRKLSSKIPNISILEWSPDIKRSSQQKDLDTNTSTECIKQTRHLKENFVCIDLNGFMHCFSIDGHSVKDGTKISLADGSISNVTTIALKHDYIVFGDLFGYLNICDFKGKTSKLINCKKGPIRKLKFAPGKENLRLIILFNDSLEIYNLSKQESISALKIHSNGLKIVDCDWCASDKPLISMSDGCIRVYDINLKQIPNMLQSLPYFNSISNYEQLCERLLGLKEYQAFKNFISEVIMHDYELKTCENYFLNEAYSKSNLKDLCENLNNDLKELLKDKSIDLVEKYHLIYLNIFPSDKFEVKFWSILEGETNMEPIFQEISQFRADQMRLLKTYEIKRGDSQNVQNLISDLILTNQIEKAFHLLIETEQSNANYLNDYLKACLVSSLKDASEISSSTKSSIKLVATNLIASGQILDGVELLTMIDLIFDACRYLQDANQWEKAAWLAKMRLSDVELKEIYKRWAEATKNKSFAALLLLSTRQYGKVIELLMSLNDSYVLLAYQFLEYCLKCNLIQIDDNGKIGANIISKDVCEKIYAKIAEAFYLLDNMYSFQNLCRKAGKRGEILLSK